MEESVSRRRVSRSDAPVAGPSRLPRLSPPRATSPGADSSDQIPTPKLPTSKLEDDRAARLRQLLGKDSNFSAGSEQKSRPLPSYSDRDSDFDTPKFSPVERSRAQDSLKDLFSKLYSEPGTTPRKKRRNSIDTSEVEASPRVQRERAKNKGKRRSFSDEEVELPSRPRYAATDTSEGSYVSSQAATFDLLRQRLASSQTQLMKQEPPTDHMSGSERTSDTETFLRGLNSSALPAVTSTPQDGQSLRMSTNSQSFPSNLLEQDSEMHRMMMGLDSFDASLGKDMSSSSKTPNGIGKRTKSFTKETEASKRHSREYEQSGVRVRTNSSHGHGKETLRSRELDRNRHHTSQSHASDELHRSFPGSSLARRKSSSASLVDNEVSSASSDAYLHDRERQWNKPNLSRPSSQISLHDEPQSRTRTLSTPSTSKTPAGRPHSSLGHHGSHGREHSLTESPRDRHSPQNHALGNSQSTAPPPPHNRSRFNSLTSSDSSSRANSPLPPVGSDDEELHERERNWNAPRPKWHQYPSHSHSHSSSHGHSRPSSPLPNGSPAERRAKSHDHSGHNQSDSLTVPGTSPSSANGSLKHRRSASPQPDRSSSRTSLHTPSIPHSRFGSTPARPPRPNSPLPSSVDPKHSSSKTVNDSSFGLNRLSTTLHLGNISPERPKLAHTRRTSSPTPEPGSRPSSRMSAAAKTSPSRIPVRSNGKSSHAVKTKDTLPGIMIDDESETKPRDDVNDLLTSDMDDVASDQPTVSMPSSLSRNDDERLRRAMGSPPSPPPSPPSHSATEQGSPLMTPPRRSSFSFQNHDFKTPSPPLGLPELPGPPSSDEEPLPMPLSKTPAHQKSSAPNGDISTFKTPKPPGGWWDTPAHNRPNGERMLPSPTEDGRDDSSQAGDSQLPPLTPKPPGGWLNTPDPSGVSEHALFRSNSMPQTKTDEDSELSYESGLATPAPSLSRSASLPAQTPSAPGSWVNTPAPRRSILKVRFEPESPADEPPLPNDPTPPLPEIAPLPRMDPLVHQSSASRGHRRATSVRLADKHGRVQSEDAPEQIKDNDAASPVRSPKKSRDSVRIVDAMGRQIEEEIVEDARKEDESIAMERNEALQNVRSGLSDLGRSLDELESASTRQSSDVDKMNELNHVSEVSRRTRNELAQTLQKVEADLQSKIGGLRAGVKRSQLAFLDASPKATSSSRPWMWLGVLCAQILVAIFMYRVLTTRAHEYFITAYYDPFYPDIHLYTSKPESPYLSVPPPRTVMKSLQEGMWRSIPPDLWRDISRTTTYYQKLIWDWWEPDGMQKIAWPPT